MTETPVQPESCIDDILTTQQLASRPSRPSDFSADNQALVELAEMMTTAPKTNLQQLANTALKLCHAESAGISIAEMDGTDEVFRWQATARAFQKFANSTLPRYFSPCGTVLEPIALPLMKNPARYFPTSRN